MKKYCAIIILLALIYSACKKTSISPNVNGLAKTANTLKDDSLLVVGNWTWSAQYTSAQTLQTLNPANTGIQEKLQFNANGTWTQTKNNAVANTGTYSFVNAYLPGPMNGPNIVTFFSIVNSKVIDTARYDNLNFDTGFSSSFELTKDSLVFYGVNTIDNSGTSYLAARVYVR